MPEDDSEQSDCKCFRLLSQLLSNPFNIMYHEDDSRALKT